MGKENEMFEIFVEGESVVYPRYIITQKGENMIVEEFGFSRWEVFDWNGNEDTHPRIRLFTVEVVKGCFPTNETLSEAYIHKNISLKEGTYEVRPLTEQGYKKWKNLKNFDS